MEKEISAEPYKANKEKDREDALNEIIDAKVNDLRMEVVALISKGLNLSSWQAIQELNREAIERIKKFL